MPGPLNESTGRKIARNVIGVGVPLVANGASIAQAGGNTDASDLAIVLMFAAQPIKKRVNEHTILPFVLLIIAVLVYGLLKTQDPWLVLTVSCKATFLAMINYLALSFTDVASVLKPKVEGLKAL